LEHKPVLLAEVLEFLAVPGISLLVDCTVGAGGHAGAFLSRKRDGTGSDSGLAIQEEARVIGIDRDRESLESAKRNLAEFGSRVSLHHAPFSRIDAVLDAEDATPDAILFDLGVSSPQLDRGERGFSFRHDGPLDMRMDQSEGESAAELIARLDEKDLGNLIFELGGERSSRRVAAAIVAEQREEPITTTGRLASIVRRAVRGRSKIDNATRTFQALRMAVNDELGELRRGLDAAARRVRSGGRIAVISFHSGEDRIVKHYFKDHEALEVLTKKCVRAGWEEARGNPRARSAKLRVVQKRDVAEARDA